MQYPRYALSAFIGHLWLTMMAMATPGKCPVFFLICSVTSWRSKSVLPHEGQDTKSVFTDLILLPKGMVSCREVVRRYRVSYFTTNATHYCWFWRKHYRVHDVSTSLPLTPYLAVSWKRWSGACLVRIQIQEQKSLRLEEKNGKKQNEEKKKRGGENEEKGKKERKKWKQ